MKYKVTYSKIDYKKTFNNFRDAYLDAAELASDDGVIDIDFLKENYPLEVEDFIKKNGIHEFHDEICIELIN